MLLDTDVLIDLIRGHPPALAWLAAMPTLPRVSGFAALELAFGSQNARELANVRKFLARFPVLWPTESEAAASLEYARLKLSQGTGPLDALTAGLAIGRGLELATFNVRHFNPIADLTVVQPYSR
jgi:predicted nucleic acid-binding protein